MGPFEALRQARRKRVAARFPVDSIVWEGLVLSRECFSRLPLADISRLKDLAAAFLREKDFLAAEPRDGGVFAFVPGEGIPYDVKLAIAAYACLPALNLGLDSLRGFGTIIVTPDEYCLKRMDSDASGIVTEYLEDVAGDVSGYGPLTVSRKDVEESGMGSGFNVVIHEIAHKLDDLDGECNGTPRLPRDIPLREWGDVFGTSFEDMRRKAKRERNRFRSRRFDAPLTPIDTYAAESESEFFAVALEYFFDDPETLATEYQAVYSLLSRWLRQDPAGFSRKESKQR